MNLHKLTNAGLAIIVFVLSVFAALKIEPTISELKESGLQSVINYDPKYRALSFLYTISITLAVVSGLLFFMLSGALLSRKYMKNRIYKIITELLTAAVLVLSAFAVFFTSDTVITEHGTTINPEEPFGKSKPYYLLGLFAGVIGILTTGSIWLSGHI